MKTLGFIVAGFIAGLIFPFWIILGMWILYAFNKWSNNVTRRAIQTATVSSFKNNDALTKILVEEARKKCLKN